MCADGDCAAAAQLPRYGRMYVMRVNMYSMCVRTTVNCSLMMPKLPQIYTQSQ